jgi:hypothetical protein
VCDAIAKKWIQGWIKNGWLTSAKKPVKNRDLWEQLLPLLQNTKSNFIGSRRTMGIRKTNVAMNWPKMPPGRRTGKLTQGYEGGD